MRKRIILPFIGIGAIATLGAFLGGCANPAPTETAANAATPPIASAADAVKAPAPPTTEVGPINVKWAASFAEASKLAKAENKLILVDFWADYCGWCKKLDAEVYVSPEFARAAKGVIAVKIDTQGAEHEVAQTYHVSGLPTILFLTPEGKPLGRIGGYLPTDQFMPMMQQAIDLYAAIPGVKAKFAANPDDLTAASDVMEIYAKLDDFGGAKKALERVQILDPQNQKKAQGRALLLTGDMYARNEKFDAAIPLFLKAASVVTEEPELFGARRGAAVCYALQNKYDKAEDQLQALLDSSVVTEEKKQEVRQLMDKVKQAKANPAG